MVSFPKFRRAVSVQPAGIPSLDTSSAGNIIRGIGTFVGALDKASVEIGGESAAARGAKEGTVLGAREPSAFTGLGKVERKAFIRQQNVEIQNDIMTHGPRILNDVTSPDKFNSKTAMQTFNAKFDGYAQGLLEHIPEGSVPNAENYLAYYKSRGSVVIMNDIHKSNRNQLMSNLYQNIDKNKELAVNSYLSGDEPAAIAAIAQAHGHIETAVERNQFTGLQAENARNTLLRATSNAKYLGQFNTALAKGKPQEFLKTFITGNQKDLNEQNKLYLVSIMDKKRSNLAAANGLNLTAMRNQVKNALANVNAGGSIDAQQPVLDKAMQFYPEQFPDLQNKIDSAQAYSGMVKQMEFMNPSQAASLIGGMKPDVKDPNFAVKQNTMNNLMQQYQSDRKALLDDSVSFLQSHPWIQQTLENRVQTAKGAQSIQTPLLPGYNNPIEGLIVAQMAMRVPDNMISVLSKSAALDFAAELKDESISPDTRLDDLSKMAAKYEAFGAKQYFFHDMVTKGKIPHSLELAYVVSQNTNSAAYREDVLNWGQSNPKDIETIVSAKLNGKDENESFNFEKINDSEAFKGIFSYPGDTTKIQSSKINDVESLAKFLYANNKAASPEDATDLAMNLEFNNNFNYPTINGHSILLSKDANEDLFVDASHHQMEIAQGLDLKVPRSYGQIYPMLKDRPDLLAQQYKQERVAHGYVLMDAAQQNASLVGSDGITVRTANNAKITFPLKDLKNPDSAIRKSLITSKSLSDFLNDQIIEEVTNVMSGKLIGEVGEKGGKFISAISDRVKQEVATSSLPQTSLSNIIQEGVAAIDNSIIKAKAVTGLTKLEKSLRESNEKTRQQLIKEHIQSQEG